jgi:hypothetical protein
MGVITKIAGRFAVAPFSITSLMEQRFVICTDSTKGRLASLLGFSLLR